MNRKERIIFLRNEIDRLESELKEERAAYLVDALAEERYSEEFGDWNFQVRRKAAQLDLVENAVPGTFYKAALNKKAIRSYLKENGSQPWGKLSDMGFTLVVKHIGGESVDDEELNDES